ncbi:MAG: type transport system permease protein [Chloroflexota bacterium]|nr:type transport system permease protein [Chloroflexota bacterium]
MTTATTTSPDMTTRAPERHGIPDDGRVTIARVIHSEWIKFRTLRSSWVMLFASFAALIAFGLIIGYNTGRHFHGLAPEDSAASGPLQGYYLGQLLMGVLGVLFVTGEYGTGMIRSTLGAVPRRLPVLVAKSVVFGAIALISMVVGSLAAFFASQLFLSHYGHGSSLSDPGVLRAVVGTGVYLGLVGLLGGAIGWIVRSTAGGISTLVGLLLVLPVLFQVLPGSWATRVFEYLPTEAGSSFVMSVRLPGTLSPGTGFVVFVLWVTAGLAAAAVVLRRRDA